MKEVPTMTVPTRGSTRDILWAAVLGMMTGGSVVMAADRSGKTGQATGNRC